MTSIQWTDQTWNPVVGCTPVSPGCLNCYAAAQAPRLGAMGQKRYIGLTVRRTERPGVTRDVFNGTVREVPDQLDKPLRRKKPTRYFIASMGDLFHEGVPFEFIDRVFAVMALCPQHTFQLLTKRPERMAEYFAEGRGETNGMGWHFSDAQRRVKACADTLAEQRRQAGINESNWNNAWPLPNVWLGTSAEDQTRLEERVQHLLRCPAAVRFLSCEPLLAALDLDRLMSDGSKWFRPLSGVWGYCGGGDPDNLDEQGVSRCIDWVIVGGESQDHARPCRLEWIRGVVAQCKAAGVPVFVKQLGTHPVGRGVCDCGSVEHGRCHSNCPSVTGVEISLRDMKGGDPTEWPGDLRVRQFPKVVSA